MKGKTKKEKGYKKYYLIFYEVENFPYGEELFPLWKIIGFGKKEKVLFLDMIEALKSKIEKEWHIKKKKGEKWTKR